MKKAPTVLSYAQPGVAARDLRSRTEPSKPQIWLLVITGLLVLTLSTYEIVTHH
jgi:hypothetical protein